MFKQTVSLITLAAFILYTMATTGCSKAVRIPVDETSFDPSPLVSRLKFKTGGDVIFDGGARYRCKDKTFDGITATGTPRRVSLSVVDSVYIQAGDSDVELSLEAEIFHREEMTRHQLRTRPIEGVYRDGQLFKFDSRYGQIDSLSRTVTGIDRQGDTLCFSFDELSALQSRKYHVPAVLVVTLVLAVAVGVAVGLSIKEQMEDFPFGN